METTNSSKYHIKNYVSYYEITDIETKKTIEVIDHFSYLLDDENEINKLFELNTTTSKSSTFKIGKYEVDNCVLLTYPGIYTVKDTETDKTFKITGDKFYHILKNEGFEHSVFNQYKDFK